MATMTEHSNTETLRREQEYAEVQAHLNIVCQRAGDPVPRLKMVKQLRGGSKVTASASLWGKPTITVPWGLSTKIDADALRALLAHELGHLHQRNSAWETGVKIMMIAVLAAVASTIYFFLDDQYIAGVVSIVSCTVWFPLWAFFNRAHEEEADRFAVDVMGLAGAAALMTHNNSSNSQPLQKRSLSRVLLTHPHPVERLASMEAHFNNK